MSSISSDETLALEGLLRWYAAMGADAAIDEVPHDRFVAETAAPVRPESVRPGPAPMPSTRAPAEAAPASADALVREAEARAAAAPDLETLRRSFESPARLRPGERRADDFFQAAYRARRLC